MTEHGKAEIFNWVKVGIAFVFGAGVFYATMANTPGDVQRLEDKVAIHDRDLAVMKNDIGYIKVGIDQLIKSDTYRRSRIDDRDPR